MIKDQFFPTIIYGKDVQLNNQELEDELSVYLLAKIMRDKTLRPWSISTVDKMLTSHKVNFFDEFVNSDFKSIFSASPIG